jgi:hypothetical protein
VTPAVASSLTPPLREFVSLLQRIEYGCVENLRIVQGEPILSPQPLIRREVKFGVEPRRYPPTETQDYQLKKQVIDLLQMFRSIGNGVVELLEIKGGLPFRAVLADEGHPFAA